MTTEDQTIACSVVETVLGLDELNVIEDVVSWRRPPDRWVGGRTAVIQLERPVVDGSAFVVEAVKLKGLGLAPSRGGPAQPPSTAPYWRRPQRRDHLHLGFDDEGELHLVESQVAPIGGLRLAAALNELRTCGRLRERGITSPVPLAVYKLDDLEFGEEPLGVVVTGLPDRRTARVSAVLDAEDGGELVPELRAAFGPVRSDGVPADSVLATLQPILTAAGREVRRFAASGHHRYSSHLDNFEFGPDAGIFLTDFDTCGWSDELDPERRVLELLRDAMSGLWNLGCVLVDPVNAAFIIGCEASVADCLAAYLSGFFDAEVAGADVRPLATAIEAAATRVANLGALVEGPGGWELLDRVRLPLLDYYGAALLMAFDAMSAGSIVGPGAPPFDRSELVRRIARLHGNAAVDRLDLELTR